MVCDVDRGQRLRQSPFKAHEISYRIEVKDEGLSLFTRLCLRPIERKQWPSNDVRPTKEFQPQSYRRRENVRIIWVSMENESEIVSMKVHETKDGGSAFHLFVRYKPNKVTGKMQTDKIKAV